jgi:hypothetical protein
VEYRIKDMSYGLLLSHTFPGLLFGLEILLAFELFTKINIINLLFLIENNASNLIAIFIAVFVSATLLGFILDGIHHFIFEDVYEKIVLKKNPYNLKLFQLIKNAEQMHIYKHFLEDDLWYPYEAYANIGIAMLPGLILLPYWLNKLQIATWFNAIVTVFYWSVFIIMIYEAKSTLQLFNEAEEKLIENFESGYSTSANTAKMDKSQT